MRSRTSSSASALAEWIETYDRRRPTSPAPAGAPRRPSLEKVRPREREQEDRCRRPCRDVLEEVEEAVVSPVSVLDDEHQGRGRRHPFQDPAPGVEEILPAEALLAAGPDEREEVRQEVRAAEEPVEGVARAQLDDRRCVVVQHPALRLHHLREGRVRDVPVRDAAAPADARPTVAAQEASQELVGEARLADPRRTDDRHELRPSARPGVGERPRQD